MRSIESFALEHSHTWRLVSLVVLHLGQVSFSYIDHLRLRMSMVGNVSVNSFTRYVLRPACLELEKPEHILPSVSISCFTKCQSTTMLESATAFLTLSAV